MKAIAFTSPGGPEVLEVMDLPDPQVGEGQVLVRVQATAVSPVDLGIRARKRSETPTVVGMDAAGVIEAIGEGTETDLTVGDNVMAFILPRGTHGGYAQRGSPYRLLLLLECLKARPSLKLPLCR